MASFRQLYSPNILRPFNNFIRHNCYKCHHQSIHLNVFKSRINMHRSHFQKSWKKYTLLISLSGVGIALSNRSKSSVSTNMHIEPDDVTQFEAEQKRLDEEAIAHLIETITVPDHNVFVWLWLYFTRWMFLMYNFTPVLFLAPFAYYNVFGIQEYWLNLLRSSVANGGSTFIKLAQWVSMRSDLFPIKICDHLAELRMRAPEHSFEETCQVIKAAFGKDIDDIFERFYIEPTASGSIAQIHKAQICINSDHSKNYFDDDMYEGNRTLFEWALDTFVTQKMIKERKIAQPKYLDVAVKVRHPNILQNMYIDISIMYMLSNFISSLPGLKGLKFPIHQTNFTQYLESQIDLSYEGKSLSKLHKNFAKHGNDGSVVIFPQVIAELSTSSVLVETWEYGVPLCNLDLNKLTHECRHSIAKQCYDVFMKMALRDNFVHGDCHSGNILIRAVDVTQGKLTNDTLNVSGTGMVSAVKDNFKRDIEGPLIFLDAGLTASLTPDGHRRFGVMMGHIATANCREAAQLFGSWAVMDENSDPHCYGQRDRFVVQLEGIIQDSLRWRYKDNNGNVIEKKGVPYISIGTLLRNVLILTQKEHILLDSSFSAVIASLGIIEGLIKTLDPAADFLQWGVPYLVKYRKLDSLRYLLT